MSAKLSISCVWLCVAIRTAFPPGSWAQCEAEAEAVAQAQIQVSQSQEAVQLAQRNYERILILFQEGAASQAELDAAFASLQTANATLDSNMLLLQAAQESLFACEHPPQFIIMTNNGAITITAYIGSGGDVDIPSETNGLPVTSIGAGAFHYCTTVTSITIPDSVVSIGDWAFVSCSCLTNVSIGNSVTSIGDSAFRGCTSLSNVTIPDSVTNIALMAFYGCSGLTCVWIGNGVTSLGMWAFSDCTSLSNVTIGNSLTSIRDGAFSYCTSLTSITIPDSVASIGDGVFADAGSLCSIFFKGNAPHLRLDSDVFDGTDNLIVYYLPGIAGWESMFGGRPTRLWNPQFQTADPTFGPGPDGFGFNIIGTADIPIVLEACTDMLNSIWVPLQTCTLSNGLLRFSDADWTNYPDRFYRIRSP